MTNKKTGPKDPQDYIVPLLMNGLEGRMLYMPAPKNKNREMLFVYGHHASLERLFGFMEILNRYGSVTMPDLPGFGGMEPFYKIGLKPSIDNLADYLAAFVKMRYKRKKVTIIGMSLGFAIVTRMLQRYPELANKVTLLVSVVGFVHYEEFIFSPRIFKVLRYGASIFSNRLPALFIKKFVIRPSLIRATYALVADRNVKLKDADTKERKRRIDFEIVLWRINDIRTYMDTSVSMFTLNLVEHRVNLPVYHVGVTGDRYFDNHIVEQHMAVIYDKVHLISTTLDSHAPTVIADAKEASGFIPNKLKRLLAQPVR
ncbi:alpha/beta hydrolase [Candidatus Saccharibacteria bacterium]|nr:alpha/beta hydrolase [Candidatus Saccharibacteria bacterium]